MNPVLVEAWRGTLVESFHRGAFAVVDAEGAIVEAAGDIMRPIYPRSAIKLHQALPLVESGAADAAGFDTEALALACASHEGEEAHERTAASMLSRLGLDHSALECGAHAPYSDAARTALALAGRSASALHNNCSGKHAGFVCLGCALAGRRGDDARGFLAGYVAPLHPVMREVGAAIEAASGVRIADAPVAIDGCSAPTWALPLRALAHAFARVATGVGLSPGHARAACRLREAAAAAPFLVGGTGRLDTKLMQHFGTRVFCKVGAEGVYCAALPDEGLGLAIKIDDGNNARACEVVLAALLARHLARQDADDERLLAGLANVTLINRRGIEVGCLRACATAIRPRA